MSVLGSIRIILIGIGLLSFGLGKSPAYGQDTLIYTNGNRIALKVTEIYTDSLKGYFLGSPDSTITFLKTGIKRLNFANGSHEVFTENYLGNPSKNKYQLYLARDYWQKRGEADAVQYYEGNAPFFVTFGTTVLAPPLGILTGGVFLISPAPVKRTIIERDAQLLQNPVYVDAYRKKMNKRKLGKTAAGFGLGAASFFIIVAVLGSL